MDSFALKTVSKAPLTVVVSGTNDRSMLYAVYRLADLKKADADIRNLDLFYEPRVAKRYISFGATTHGRRHYRPELYRKNLSGDSKYQDKLTAFREAVSKHIRETGDLRFFPHSTRESDGPFKEWVSKTSFPLKTLWEATETASAADPGNQDRLKSYLASEHQAVRYWGASGFATLGALGKLQECPEKIIKAIKDSNEDVAVRAAEAACHLGRVDAGLPALVNSFQDGSTPAYSCLETLTWYEKTAKALKQYVNVFRAMKNQKARSILFNLGEIPVDDLYDEKAKKQGATVNKKRRSIGPES